MSEYPYLDATAAQTRGGAYSNSATPSAWSTKTPEDILADVNAALAKCREVAVLPDTFYVKPAVWFRLRWWSIGKPAMRLLGRRRRRPARFSVCLK